MPKTLVGRNWTGPVGRRETLWRREGLGRRRENRRPLRRVIARAQAGPRQSTLPCRCVRRGPAGGRCRDRRPNSSIRRRTPSDVVGAASRGQQPQRQAETTCQITVHIDALPWDNCCLHRRAGAAIPAAGAFRRNGQIRETRSLGEEVGIRESRVKYESAATAIGENARGEQSPGIARLAKIAATTGRQLRRSK